MSESTTDKPTTGKNVGGPMYSESTQRLLHDIAMSPNARRTLDAINAEHFNGSDDDVAAVMAREEKPADSGPVYLVRPHVPAEQQKVIDLTNSRSRKLVKAERAVDELREHVRAFRRCDREGNTDAWATLNHHLLKVCTDRLQEFHNDVVEVLGSGETFTSATSSEPRLQMVSGGSVHEVPLYVQLAMAYHGQSPDEYFAEPSDLRNALEKTINTALLDLRERGCILTPIDASRADRRWVGHRTFVEHLTMAIRGQSAHEYFREPEEIRRDSERRTATALKVIGHTLAPVPDRAADDSATEKNGQKAFEDGSGDRDPGAEADAEALRHETAVRAQYAVNAMSKDARRGLLDVIATLHPKLVLDTLTDVNTARRVLDLTLDGWRP